MSPTPIPFSLSRRRSACSHQSPRNVDSKNLTVSSSALFNGRDEVPPSIAIDAAANDAETLESDNLEAQVVIMTPLPFLAPAPSSCHLGDDDDNYRYFDRRGDDNNRYEEDDDYSSRSSSSGASVDHISVLMGGSGSVIPDDEEFDQDLLEHDGDNDGHKDGGELDEEDELFENIVERVCRNMSIHHDHDLHNDEYQRQQQHGQGNRRESFASRQSGCSDNDHVGELIDIPSTTISSTRNDRALRTSVSSEVTYDVENATAGNNSSSQATDFSHADVISLKLQIAELQAELQIREHNAATRFKSQISNLQEQNTQLRQENHQLQSQLQEIQSEQIQSQLISSFIDRSALLIQQNQRLKNEIKEIEGFLQKQQEDAKQNQRMMQEKIYQLKQENDKLLNQVQLLKKEKLRSLQGSLSQMTKSMTHGMMMGGRVGGSSNEDSGVSSASATARSKSFTATMRRASTGAMPNPIQHQTTSTRRLSMTELSTSNSLDAADLTNHGSSTAVAAAAASATTASTAATRSSSIFSGWIDARFKLNASATPSMSTTTTTNQEGAFSKAVDDRDHYDDDSHDGFVSKDETEDNKKLGLDIGDLDHEDGSIDPSESYCHQSWKEAEEMNRQNDMFHRTKKGESVQSLSCSSVGISGSGTERGRQCIFSKSMNPPLVASSRRPMRRRSIDAFNNYCAGDDNGGINDCPSERPVRRRSINHFPTEEEIASNRFTTCSTSSGPVRRLSLLKSLSTKDLSMALNDLLFAGDNDDESKSVAESELWDDEDDVLLSGEKYDNRSNSSLQHGDEDDEEDGEEEEDYDGEDRVPSSSFSVRSAPALYG